MSMNSKMTDWCHILCLNVGLLMTCLLAMGVRAEPTEAVSVVDDLGRTITLAAPAKRIISLAPHLTENLFTVGAGDQVVGVVEYSNFPEQARHITSVGNFSRFNIEAIIALQPDLIVGWFTGNGEDRLQQLVALGFSVYYSEPETLNDVATSLQRLGVLSGHKAQANQAALAFNQKVAQLRRHYQQQQSVTVFYQVWDKPLMTLSGNHLISDIMQLCGGINVFANMVAIAPQLSIESVLQANPQVIVASGDSEERPQWLDQWQEWPAIQAVKLGHIYSIPPDYLQRHTVRVLQGATAMCEVLHKVRQHGGHHIDSFSTAH